MSKTKTKEKPIVGFFDTSCPKCRGKYGWHGKITNKPSCPRCGHGITPQEMEDADFEIRTLKMFDIVRMLFREHPEQMGGTEGAFIQSMYDYHTKNKKYSDVQKESIERIAKKYGVLE